MNGSQAIVLFVAALDIVLMLLFPPYNSIPAGRDVAVFDAFYFVFEANQTRVKNWNLLTIELCWVLANTTIAWLLLIRYRPGQALMSRRSATLAFTFANLALVLLFLPFEGYASAARLTGMYFDGFYFAFGDKAGRRLYVPLLYLEVLLLLINCGVLWLLFRDPAPASGTSNRD
jgi:hypothetical protein